MGMDQMKQSLTALLTLLAMVAQAAASGPDQYDAFCDDGTSATANRVTINMPQTHEIAAADDWDWATFDAEQGMPYSIKLEHVGADVDVELFVYFDGPTTAGLSTDMASFGGAEIYSRQSWPAAGRFWIAVHAWDWRDGATSYTLTVTRNTGANLGLATISGTKMSTGGPDAGGLMVPDQIPLDGSFIIPMYTKHALDWQADTFTSATSHLVLLGGLGDPANSLSSPYVASWLEMFPHNLTITRVGLSPAVDPLRPLSLTIEMKTNVRTLDLSDGSTTIAGFIAQDVPAGARPQDARVWHWSQTAGEWRLFDESPSVVQVEGAWRVTTHVSHLDLDVLSSDYFAASIELQASGANDWAAYE